MSITLLTIASKAFQLFLVLDPLGNTGIIATMLSHFSKEKQRKILFRELLIALIIMIIMFFAGFRLLNYLNLSQAAITITGGIIFFLFAIDLLFPGSEVVNFKQTSDEPFIVPIATPLVVGPSSIATIILLANDQELYILSLISVICAWIITSIIILMGPYLSSILGKTGMLVMERFIGLICTLIAIKMLIKGLSLFIQSLNY